MYSIKASVIVTFHSEGLLAVQTLQSIEEFCRYASTFGIDSELILVLDCATEETMAIAKKCCLNNGNTVLRNVENGDLGLSRNDGISLSSGEVIIVIDGDDLYPRNYLERMVHFVKIYGDNAIVHPEYCISFGVHTEIFCMKNQFGNVLPVDQFLQNHWCSWAAAYRRVFLSSPYQSSSKRFFCHEDWHWNCETMASGFMHYIANGVAGFYRRKSTGLCNLQAAQGSIIAPTKLFNILK